MRRDIFCEFMKLPRDIKNYFRIPVYLINFCVTHYLLRILFDFLIITNVIHCNINYEPLEKAINFYHPCFAPREMNLKLQPKKLNVFKYGYTVESLKLHERKES